MEPVAGGGVEHVERGEEGEAAEDQRPHGDDRRQHVGPAKEERDGIHRCVSGGGRVSNDNGSRFSRRPKRRDRAAWQAPPARHLSAARGAA